MNNHDPQKGVMCQQNHTATQARDFRLLLCAAIGPFPALVLYFWVVQWFVEVSTFADVVAVCGFLAFGVRCIWLSSLSRWAKSVIIFLYVPCMYFCLGLLGLLCAGYFWGHWL